MAKNSKTQYLSDLDDNVTGTTGNDIIYGNAGNDVIFGEDGNDYLYGGIGNDTLMGEDGNDWLYGGNGDDILNGGEGNNVLNGGYGADTFVVQDFHLHRLFGVLPPTQPANTIADFVTGVDKLLVSTNSFGDPQSQEVGLIRAANFTTGTPGADHFYIYNRATGNFYFDPDALGEQPQILIATLLGHPDLKASDIETYIAV